MQEVTEFGLFFEFPAGLPESGPQTLHEQAVALTVELQRWNATQQKISEDGELSATGKEARFAELTRTSMLKVDAVAAGRHHVWTREAIGNAIDAERAALDKRFDPPTPATDADGLRAELQAREIRDALRGMDPNDRYRVMRDAAELDDLATLRAVRAAPPALALATSDQWAHLDRVNLERHHVARVHALHRLEKLAEALDHNIDIARRTVQGRGRRKIAPPR